MALLNIYFYQSWASRKQAEKGAAEMAVQGPPLGEMAGRGPPPTPDDFFEEEVALNISPGIVVLFVCLMGGMLVVLYYFFKYLVYFLIGMFAIGAIVSTIVVFEPLIYRLPIGTTRIPQKYIPCFHGPLEIRQLALIVASAGLAVFWVVIRHQSYSWMLQNFFGVMFGINLLKSLRMPSLMIIFWMLVLLFVYDIFFVFLTPYVTKKPVNETGSLGKTKARGDSIMVEVAKGTDSREMIPMVLRVPRMINKEMEACVSRYALLGYGDIIIPGLLIAYCHGFDLIHTMGRLYYIQGVISYGIGLVITFVALYLMRTAQPALLYLVPATLIPTIVTSYFRGHFRDIWSGAWPMLSESEDAPAPPAGKTSQPEEDEEPRLAHGNKRLSREPYVQQQPYAHGPHGQGLYGPDTRSQMWRPT